ncbi:MAG: ATP-binding protein [Clostridia bacterium]|nr:ATP-binding protein [Clostridia bacterium]
MIKKLVRTMLIAQVFSALTVSLCLLIDSIMIGRFLGETAIAAYGLSNPLLLAIGAIGTLLSAGIQVVCSKSLGRGSQEETNAGYSSALAVSGGVSLLFLLLVVLFGSPLATLMGAGSEGELFTQTRDYLLGFSIGAPGSMGALVLVPFMQMAGQSGLLIVAVLGMTVSDVVLDLLNVLVFHGGMFGMGLASSLSYYVAVVIGACYFLSRRCAFRFSPKGISWKKIRELFRCGIPAGFNMLSTVILVFVLNQILTGTGSANAVAAYSVITTIGNAANCITTGIGGISLTLAGIFYNEEDRTSLKQLLHLLCRYSVILGVFVGILLLVCAPLMVTLFVPNAGAVQDMAVLGVRLFAAGLIPCCLNNALKNAYQATDRSRLTEIISMLEGAVLPAIAAFIFSRFLGTTGVWLYFISGELLMLLLIGLYVRLRTGSMPWRDGAALLLRPDFGQTSDDLMEVDIHSVEEVAAVSEQAQHFCESHGQSGKIANRIAVCIEEMAVNTIQHGFVKDNKPHHLSVRVLYKPDAWVLRFRDDCGAFDPVHYVPREGKDALGIRLTLAMASEVSYTYSLSLNNLTLKLPAEEAD